MNSLPGVSANDDEPRVIAADLDLGRVLVPLDGFAAAEFALSYASVFARCSVRTCCYSHVLPPAHPSIRFAARQSGIHTPPATAVQSSPNSYLQEVASDSIR